MSIQDEIDAQKYREWKNKTKNYNADYYSENKEVILAALLKKTKCELCGKIVNYQQMNRHKKSKYCERHNCNHTSDNKVNAMMMNIERLHAETKLIYSAAKPFQDFSLKNDDEYDRNRYMKDYREICRKLTTGEIKHYDDLTIWEQDLCANRGVCYE
jgi:hypothetical protein